MIISVLLITVVLLQQSEDSVQDAFSGSSSELFKNKKVRGFDLFMMRSTTMLSILLLVLVVISNYQHSISL
ncbi:MAG TPA: preprotein translocase subunit SecG [Acholeplasmataceae bacterium]|nr:preprotein translocase subunit SecG [Acholeplasmataceae bacterium]